MSLMHIKAYSSESATDFYLEHCEGSLFLGTANSKSWRNALLGKGGRRKTYPDNLSALKSSLSTMFSAMAEVEL